MTEMVTSGSMSGEGKRGDGPLGESSNERKCSLQAPPVRTAAAPLLDSTGTTTPAAAPLGGHSRAAAPNLNPPMSRRATAPNSNPRILRRRRANLNPRMLGLGGPH